jgi:hypothetical protein
VQTESRSTGILNASHRNPVSTAEERKRMFFAARNSSMTSAQSSVIDAQPIALWDAWEFAASEATLKLRIWSTAPHKDKAYAHAAYLAALDREEHAALVLGNRLSAQD